MDPLRFNWDSALIISPHDSNRIYFAAQYLFRSDDRGDSWKPVSGDLTRKVNRNELPVMGRVWGIDAVAKNTSTSFYGNIVSLAESPLREGLLYVGTDDGLIQISEDGGANWRKVERVPGVPDRTYVSHLAASSHNPDVVYAAFDNHKTGDFKPYLFRSADRGRTWTPMASNLPVRGTTYVVVEDHVDPKLLFAGTEFGLYFTQNGGSSWIELDGGFPTIAVRDLWIQKRHNDLVVATFGRGFYILDDYTPLRTMTPSLASREATVFTPRETPLYVERFPLGLPGKGFQGDSFFTAPNPPYGAVFTYYLKDELKSRKKQRWATESKVEKDGGNEPVTYPTWDQLRIEERELEPSVVLTVFDDAGNVVRRVSGPAKSGLHRVAWDLRYPPPLPIRLDEPERNPFSTPPAGPLVVPGNYRVQLSKRVDGVETPLSEPQPFNVVPLYLSTMSAADRAAMLEFQKRAAGLQRVVLGADQVTSEALERILYLRKAIDQIEGSDPALMAEVNRIDAALRDIDEQINGDAILNARSEPAPPSLKDRVSNAVNGLTTTLPPTATHRASMSLAETEATQMLERLRRLIEVDLAKVETTLNQRGAPWTPGRVPRM
jgi:photosystem II stability/assembly factor-like uncharacterized protein